MPEKLQDLPLKFIATGSLGYKGVSVDSYSFHDDGGNLRNTLVLNDVRVYSVSIPHWQGFSLIWSEIN